MGLSSAGKNGLGKAHFFSPDGNLARRAWKPALAPLGKSPPDHATRSGVVCVASVNNDGQLSMVYRAGFSDVIELHAFNTPLRLDPD